MTLVVTEFGDDTTDDRFKQYLRYEAVCNETFAWFDTAMLCLGDPRRVAPEVLTRFRVVHPRSLTVNGPETNGDYLPPHEFLDHDSDDPPPTPPTAPDLDRELGELNQLAALRQAVRGWAGLRVTDLDLTDDRGC